VDAITLDGSFRDGEEVAARSPVEVRVFDSGVKGNPTPTAYLGEEPASSDAALKPSRGLPRSIGYTVEKE